MNREPIIIIQSVVAALNVVQVAAVAMPVLAHVILLAAIVGLGAFVSRSQVKPA